MVRRGGEQFRPPRSPPSHRCRRRKIGNRREDLGRVTEHDVAPHILHSRLHRRMEGFAPDLGHLPPSSPSKLCSGTILQSCIKIGSFFIISTIIFESQIIKAIMLKTQSVFESWNPNSQFS